MDFKKTIPKFYYSNDFVRLRFETKKLDVVVDVRKDLSTITAKGWTIENDFNYHLKHSEIETIKSWVTKQEHKRNMLRELKNDLEVMNAKLIDKLQEVKSMLDEGDDDIKWELDNNIKLDYDSERYRDWETDRKSTRLNSSHSAKSRMPSSA